MKNTKRCPEHFLWHSKLPQKLVVYNNFLEFTICGSETRQVQLGDSSAHAAVTEVTSWLSGAWWRGRLPGLSARRPRHGRAQCPRANILADTKAAARTSVAKPYSVLSVTLNWSKRPQEHPKKRGHRHLPPDENSIKKLVAVYQDSSFRTQRLSPRSECIHCNILHLFRANSFQNTTRPQEKSLEYNTAF